MTPFDWNGLRRGDAVFVHASSVAAEMAVAGTVRFVETEPGRANEVGIRLDGKDRPVVWPPASAVHEQHRAPSGACWRCDRARATAPG